MLKLYFFIYILFTIQLHAQTNSHPGGGLPSDPAKQQETCADSIDEIDRKEKKFVQGMGVKYKDGKSFFQVIDGLSLKLTLEDARHGKVCSSEEKEELKKILGLYEESRRCVGDYFVERTKYTPVLKNIIHIYE